MKFIDYYRQATGVEEWHEFNRKMGCVIFLKSCITEVGAVIG